MRSEISRGTEVNVSHLLSIEPRRSLLVQVTCKEGPSVDPEDHAVYLLVAVAYQRKCESVEINLNLVIHDALDASKNTGLFTQRHLEASRQLLKRPVFEAVYVKNLKITRDNNGSYQLISAVKHEGLQHGQRRRADGKVTRIYQNVTLQ
ncbi:hypothetical protein J6590_104728 [Homalodisca vitripennis]|nr:hypothetical protein J6590_104728 [Homalodisca vitripennis]